MLASLSTVLIRFPSLLVMSSMHLGIDDVTFLSFSLLRPVVRWPRGSVRMVVSIVSFSLS